MYMDEDKNNSVIDPTPISDSNIIDSPITSVPIKKQLNKKRIAVVSIILLVCILVLSGLVWRIYNSRATSGSTAISNSNSMRFFGQEIPQIDCGQVDKWAKDPKLLKSSKSRYICNKGEFTVDSEKITYVSIYQTPEYEQEWSAKHPNTCTLDCGSSPDDFPPTSPESVNDTYIIVRANGKIEYPSISDGKPNESLLNNVTGCGTESNFGKFEEIKNGKLVIDNSRLGLLSKYSALKVTDRFGNVCTLDLEIVSYLTTTSTSWEAINSMRVKSAAVLYDLKTVSSCSSYQAISERQSCYTSQATMRNDARICDNIVALGGLTAGYDGCAIAVAKRNRDPQDCDKIRYFREQLLTQCQTEAKQLQSILKDDLLAK
jgi:hypothetical protein